MGVKLPKALFDPLELLKIHSLPPVADATGGILSV
jgi:hypothetical protein